MENKEINYIAGKYKEGRFSAIKALTAMGFGKTSWWTKTRIAASIAIAVCLTTTATIIVRSSFSDNASGEGTTQEIAKSQAVTGIVKVIDFEDAPLTQVVDKIEDVYDVEITGMPANAADYKLSLHYEGNVKDLIDTINELLDTELAIKEEVK